MRFRLLSLLAMPLLAVLGACSGDGSPAPATGTPTGAPAGALAVIAGNYPLTEFAQKVGGSLVSVTNLASPGIEPHDVELTPQQIEEVGAADLIVLIPGYQPALDDAVDAAGADDRSMDATAGIQRMTGGGDGEEQDALDPHTWLDPTLAATMVNNIAARLAEIDASNAATYRANAATYAATLRALDGEYQAGLADCDRRDFITTHAAFGYLAKKYNLVQEPIAGLTPESEPSPQQIQDVIEFAKQHDVKVIFFEELVSPDLAETIANEVGAKTLVLSPMEARTEEQQSAGKDIVSMARDNLVHLREALGCR